MITALILIYTALIFALGAIVGSLNKKGEMILEKQKPKAELNSEILNFLYYDGTSQ